MNSSLEINALVKAIVEAKKNFKPALKNANNPHYKSKYTELSTVIDATEDALLEHGVVVFQGVGGSVAEQCVRVTTRLVHASGQWIEDTLELPATNRQNFDPQSAGSAITYGRRYGLMAMLCIAGEDDDGNAASAVETSVAHQKAHPSEKDELDWSFNQKSGLLICRVIDATQKTSTGKDKRPFYAVKLNHPLADKKDMIFCWHQSMFAPLSKAKGNICKFLVSCDSKGFWSLDEVLEVAGEKFEAEGSQVTGQLWESLVAEAAGAEGINELLTKAGSDMQKVQAVVAETKKRGYEFDQEARIYRDPTSPF